MSSSVCHWPKYLVLTAILLGLSAPDQARAQSEAVSPAVASPTLDEIVVTASKREEALQDTLGSVSAFSGETLAQNNVQDFNSLVELVPGMVAQDEDKIAIRGISRTRDGPSPVAFHVNDVFIAMRGEPFYDLEAVEILRGPSGTVFGRNATAGAINAKWQRPESDWGAGGSLRVSSLMEKEFKAYLNAPLLGEDNDALQLRAAMMSRRNHGKLDDLLASNDRDPGYVEDQFARLYLASALSDDISLNIRAIHYDSDGGSFYTVASPSRATRQSGVLEEAGAMPMPDDETKVRSRVRDTYGEGFERFTRLDGDVSWSLHGLGPLGDLDVVLVGGVQWRESTSVFDLDGTEEVLTEGANPVRDEVRRTAELRFLSRNDTGFDWLLGLFWYRLTSESALFVDAFAFARPSQLGLGPSFPGEPEIPAIATVEATGEHNLDESVAVFLNLDFDMAKLFQGPDVQLTFGIRQNRDEFAKNTDRSTISFTDTTLGIGPVPYVEQTNLVQEAAFSATTGEVAARWFYADDEMAYAKVSRGYKPGLAQRLERADGVIVQNPVAPEFLTAIEAGWKAAFWDQRLQVNVAGFYYDYEDLQVSQITPGGVLTENAAAATIQGLEFELRLAPHEALFIHVSGGWTDATYDNYCGTDSAFGEDVETDPGCTAENPMDFSGARMTAAPRFSFALLGSYIVPLGRMGALTTTLKTSWNDEMDRRGLGNPNDKIKAHSTSDIRIAWDSPDQRWTVMLFGENLEGNDDTFFQAFTPLIQGRDNSFSLINNIPPRLFGMGLEARF